MNRGIGSFAWLRLPMVAMLMALGIVALLLAQNPSPAYAYAASLDIECHENPVQESQTFRLNIVNSQVTPGQVETMKVYWSTTSGTAHTTEYTALRREAQTSSAAQSTAGRMGRTFYTTEGTISELTESFTVKAVNAEDNNTVGTCTIEMEDNDGPGAYKTWIDSTPGEDRGSEWEAGVQPNADKYFKGETMRLKQKFTEAVHVIGGEVTVGLHIGNSNSHVRRGAKFVGGTGTDTLTFEYEVRGDEWDPDGFAVLHSEYADHRFIMTKEGGNPVNRSYWGATGGDNHKIYGRAYVEEITLTPP